MILFKTQVRGFKKLNTISTYFYKTPYLYKEKGKEKVLQLVFLWYLQ